MSNQESITKDFLTNERLDTHFKKKPSYPKFQQVELEKV